MLYKRAHLRPKDTARAYLRATTVYFLTLEDPCQTSLCMHTSRSEANQSLIARGQLGQLAPVSIAGIQYILRSTINSNW